MRTEQSNAVALPLKVYHDNDANTTRPRYVAVENNEVALYHRDPPPATRAAWFVLTTTNSTSKHIATSKLCKELAYLHPLHFDSGKPHHCS